MIGFEIQIDGLRDESMTSPLVSMLIPVYNAERSVAETVRSALGQTWPRTEIIAVDDGSDDRSLAVLREIQSPALRVLSQSNAGPSAARNLALREAQGDFIQYLDADDLLEPTKVEQQVRLLQANPPDCVAVCSTCHFLDGTEPADGVLDDFGPSLGDSDDPIEWLLRLYGLDGRAGMVQTSCWLTPRTIADKAALWDERLTVDEDGEYFNRILLAGSGVRVWRSVGVYYRKYKDGRSQSTVRGRRDQRSALTAIQLKAERMLKVAPHDAARRVFAHHFIERAFLCYPDYPDLAEEALRQHDSLGGRCEFDYHFGRLQWVRRLFGWRTACRIRTAKRDFLRQWRRLRQDRPVSTNRESMAVRDVPSCPGERYSESVHGGERKR
jgi:glycosyltransferase involved in cell wall biosynthesis